jgi:peptide/nickel transport system permease protein
MGSTFFSAFPPFWLGLLLLYFFGFRYHAFPLTGGYTPGATPSLTLSFLGDAFVHSVLPAVTLVVTSLAGWVVGMRNNMINTLGEDYVLLAQAKGLKGSWVAWMYVARNAILPNITGFAMALGFVVGGSLLTEIVFSYPGMGYLLYNAVINEDYPLIEGCFLIIVVCVVIINFIADLAYAFFDPRVRRGGAV